MNSSSFLLLLSSLLILVDVYSCLYLYSDDFDVRQHLSTKSPYFSLLPPNNTHPDGCQAIHLDLVARHGSRDPTSGDINALNVLAADLAKYGPYITNSSFFWMKTWTNPFLLINQGYLSPSGEREHYHLGERNDVAFSPLLNQTYLPNVYVIQSTQVSRTGVSASAYTYGFLHDKGDVGPYNYEPVFVSTESASLDVTLRFFDVCQQYVQAVSNNTINSRESDKYIARHYPIIAESVAKRLGVYGVWNITNSDVDTLFSACAFEASVDLRTDGYCTLFTPEEVEIYEYAEDLDNYYVKGYGAGFGYEISAPLLQNIVQGIDKIIAGKNSVEAAYLRFAHAETVMPLVSLLGLFKDEKPITADSTQEEIENRKWRTSIISPFAANLMFVLYKCDAGDFRVKLLHNEVEYLIPGCDAIDCTYTQFKKVFNTALNYNFTKVCDIPKNIIPDDDHSHDVVMKQWEAAVAFVFCIAITAILAITGSAFYFRAKYTSLRYSNVPM